MRTVMLLGVLAVIACGDPTGLSIDPTVRITNNTNWPVYFEWRDGQGVLGADTIAGLARVCERFFARADSAYFYMEATNPNPGGTPATTRFTAPWFDPAARHAWSAVVSDFGGSPDIAVRQDSTVAAC